MPGHAKHLLQLKMGSSEITAEFNIPPLDSIFVRDERLYIYLIMLYDQHWVHLKINEYV